MRPPRAQHLGLDALGALRRRAAQTITVTAAPRWARSAASDRDSNPFRRAPTPLEGENLPEAQFAPAPSKPWPKPQPVAAVPSPPAKPRQPVERTIKPDPPSTFRRRATPLDGEVLIGARPVPPPPKPRTATTPASSATKTCEPDRKVPKPDPRMYRYGVPTPMPGEALIKPRDASQKKRTPPPEPAPATPLSREEAKQLSLRKPELFDGEDTPIKIPVSLLTDHHDQVGDDMSQDDAQWTAPTVPDRQSLQEGKVFPLENIRIGKLLTFGIPRVSIGDSLRCIASFNQGPIYGNPPIRDLYVPGAPPIFKERQVPHFLTPGPEQVVMRPSYRYESAFMAMRAMSDICLDDVDVVLTGSYLRSLFATCRDKRFLNDIFRPPNLCTLIRDTLVIHGIVEDDDEIVRLRAKKRPDHLQRGHMFQDNFTQVSEDRFYDTNYFRILQYRLGNLNCLVIVETDAVLPHQRHDDSDRPPSLDETLCSDEIPLDIQPVPRGPDTGDGWRPRLVPAGTFAEHRTWTELKIGTQNFSDLMSQMYFCNNLFAVYGLLGYNTIADKENPERWNNIYKIIKQDLRDRISTWEQEEQPALRRTVALIRQLRAIARRQGEGQTCMFWRATKLGSVKGADQPAEAADQPAEAADQPAAGPQNLKNLKADDMVMAVKTWHKQVRPLPQELVDHFWTPPGSGTKPQRRELLRYYKCPVNIRQASEIDDYLGYR